MTFNTILTSDASDEAKLIDIANIITGVRNEYGNTYIDIEIPYVNTPNGTVNMKYLDNESKLHLAKRAITEAISTAVEECEENSAAIFDKELERILATSPVLANLLTLTESKYI